MLDTLVQMIHAGIADEGTCNGDEDDKQHQQCQLDPSAQQGSQQGQVGGRPEHIPMHQLPPRLLADVMLQRLDVIVVSRVLGIVIAQGAQQDHGNQTGQEDDHHEGVEDGEPVYLQQQLCFAITDKLAW